MERASLYFLRKARIRNLADKMSGKFVVCRREEPAPAWLIIQSDGTRSVVLSPLTDDVYMDEGAEAWALYRVPEKEKRVRRKKKR